jgi:isoquinoline 1-oxidoreductase beta subunit
MTLYPGLRQAAAYAREQLKAEAAKKLNVAVSALSVVNGVIFNNTQATEHTYGSLLGNQTIVNVLGEDAKPPLKTPDEFQVIGQSVLRHDLRDKVTGTAKYGYDARVPNMKFGKVLKPPTLGATFRSADVSAAQQEPGVLQVVQTGSFVGVVAETHEAATRAVNKIKAEWNERWPLDQQAQLDAKLVPSGWGGEVIKEEGDVNAALRRGTLVEAAYITPFASHAMLEPPGAAAYVRQENGQWLAEVWTATQGANLMQTTLASELGLKAEEILIHAHYLGGGFGRKVINDAASEAARLSKATGLPVRVNWDRAEEFQSGYLRPPTHSQLQASVENGRISGWEHKQASGMVLFAFFPPVLRYVFGSDFGATRGAVPRQYAFAHQRTTAWLVDTPAKTGSWRGLGLLPNSFAVESFLDELAHAANADPLEFRLNHLSTEKFGPRMRRALERVAQISNWNEPLVDKDDGWKRGRGVACCEDVQTVVAQVAEVAVNVLTGEIKVERVYCTVDCGLAINPDSVRAQVEGNVMWGVSSTLLEELTIKDGKVSASNFGAYPLLTIRQAPEVITEVIENKLEGPFGMGEPPIGPVAAAIGNAVFNAVGIRLRRLPMTPVLVKAALNS